MSPVASISDRVGDVGGYLREQREHARLSVRQLASLAGVSNPYLSQVERGLRRPSAEVLQQIARGLRISAEALYVRAGILDDERGLDVEAAVNADPDLNERQRRVLLDIYASFRAENRRSAQDAPPPPRRRVAASSARVATRVRSRPGSAAAGADPVVDPVGPAEPEVPAPEVSTSEVPVTEVPVTVTAVTAQEAVTPQEPEAPEVPGPTPTSGGRRPPSKRATKRATGRTTATSTRAARKATAAREQAPSAGSSELGGDGAAPGGRP